MAGSPGRAARERGRPDGYDDMALTTCSTRWACRRRGAVAFAQVLCGEAKNTRTVHSRIYDSKVQTCSVPITHGNMVTHYTRWASTLCIGGRLVELDSVCRTQRTFGFRGARAERGARGRERRAPPRALAFTY